jgi:hypothetical protein
MIELKNKELYLYGTLLALVEEQQIAIQTLAEGRLGWFGKNRIAPRGEKITSYIDGIIGYKKRNPNRELSEIPIELKSQSDIPEIIAIIADLQNIKFRNSNLDKFYSDSIWKTLETYLGYELEKPSELRDKEEKLEPSKKDNIPSDLQYNKEHQDKKFGYESQKREEEYEEMQLDLQKSGLKHQNKNTEEKIINIDKKILLAKDELKKDKLEKKKKLLNEYIEENNQEIIRLDASLNLLIRRHQEAQRERSIDLHEKRDLEKFKNFFEEGLITKEIYMDILKKYTER